MNSIVIYASHFGNTRAIAEAIAEGLRTHGTVTLIAVEEAPVTLPPGTDLIVMGGPTEVHRMTTPAAEFFDRMTQGALSSVAAAAFDTRLRQQRWLTGSVANGIARKLRHRGARVVTDPESFFVEGAPATLLPGEIERARAWSVMLASQMEAKESAIASSTR
jgi:flavodoxin